MYRVVVLDPLASEGLALFEAAPQIEYEVCTGLTGDELRQSLADADGAICRSGVRITADVLAGNNRLKAIARAGVGTDNIDLDVATRQGIVVMNTPAGNTLSTAEHTVAMMLALSRNIAPAYAALTEGRWDRKRYIGTQLAGKTLGVVGLGRIGQAVADRAIAFKMRVLAYDPFVSQERAGELGVELCPSVDEMLPHVDYLTVHTPLNDATRNLIGTRQIERMRTGVRLINCARGGIYDEAALEEGLKSGHLAGVALDVYAREPCTDSPLFGMPGVLATPHLGASTEEAQAEVAREGAELLIDFLTTGAVRHAVNTSPLDHQTLEALRGYLDLAYRLGLLHAQLHPIAPKLCRLYYRGEVAAKNIHLMTSAFAAGLLEAALEGTVNIVNAEVLIRERGIELVEESRSEMGSFRSLISADLVAEKETHRVSGTLFGNHMPRLVQLGAYRLEAYLDGILLVFTHRDVPGIIGLVGTIFGKHQVNIAQMAVGRSGDAPGGESIGVLNLDNLPPQAAIDEVIRQDNILSATVAKLPAAGDLPRWLSS